MRRMTRFTHLLTASTAMHAADQLTLAAAPLIAVAAGADPAMIGLIVAAQSVAWLIVSLPAGALADRLSRRSMMIGGAMSAIAGSLMGLAALRMADASLIMLSLACFAAAAGIVIVVLSIFALLPAMIAKPALPRANARIELMRAIVTFGAPSLAAWLVSRGAGEAIFALTALCGAIALVASAALPRDAAAASSPPVLAAVRDGARFVIAHPALRAIALCAIFWNIAFFALIGLFAPLATKHLAFDAQAIGRVWSVYGAGLIAGALFASIITARVSLGVLLLFGPAVSVAAGLIIATASRATPEPLIDFAFFLIGFGPMLWLVTQTSLRQSVTPPELMGRVGATIQVAIYGVRPLGALIAGWVGARWGLGYAAAIPLVFFSLSFASMLMQVRAAAAHPAPAAG
jgi:predicted MFS family arabinose efflux permease